MIENLVSCHARNSSPNQLFAVRTDFIYYLCQSSMSQGAEKQAGLKVSDLLPTAQVESLSVHPPSRAELLEALKIELASQENQVKRAGWSQWALLGALAAITWFCLGELETGKYLPAYTLAVFLLFSLLIEIWDPFRLILEPGIDNTAKPLRFLLWRFVGAKRIVLVAHIVRSFCLFLAAYYLAHTMKVGIYLACYWGVNVAISLLGLLVTYADLLLPLTVNRRTVLLSFAFMIPALVGTIWLIDSIAELHSLDFSSIRLGLAAGGGLLLLIVLCDGMNPAPITSILLEIQRDLSFGRITIENAYRQADIALAGLRMSDVLQRELQPLVSALEKLNTSRQEASARLNLAKKMLDEHGGTQRMNDEQIQVFKSVLESANTYFAQNRETDSEVKRLAEKMQNKLKPAFLIEPQVKIEIESVVDRIKRVQADCQRDCNTMETEVKEKLLAIADRNIGS